MGVSVRTARLRYTEWRDFTTGRVVASELYDHEKDPDENHNVIASPPNAGELQTAKRLLAANFPRRPPVVAHRLKYRAPNLKTDLGVGLWAWPMPMDWDGDGDYDLVVSCPDVPFRGTYLFENPGTDGKQLKFPVFKSPVLVGPRLSNATLSLKGRNNL